MPTFGKLGEFPHGQQMRLQCQTQFQKQTKTGLEPSSLATTGVSV